MTSTHEHIVDVLRRTTGVVLDIGAATGAGSRVLTEAGLRVVGVEYDAELAAHLVAAVPGVRADARALPFRDRAVSAAVITEVLEHIEGGGVLAEVARVTAPGGVLCLSVPTAYSERVYGRLHPRYRSNAGHLREFSRARLTEEIEAAGWRVTRLETINLLPAVSWLVHAALRSEADQTGAILEHHLVDRVLARCQHELVRTRAGAALWRRAEQRVGKSYYVEARRA